jgi:hypothetical protein
MIVPEKLMFSLENQNDLSEIELTSDNWEDAANEIAEHFGFNLLVRAK